MRIAFAWDNGKAISNLAKHGVSFAFASRVFLDADMIGLDTTRPGDKEIRRKAVGLVEGRIFTVVYTVRDGVTRIISARRCNAKEARAYGAVHS